MPFEDHFSRHADLYAQSRPTYPSELFEWLASIAPARDAAWDAGAGNGQAATALAGHFARVFATDASTEQLARARPCANVEYRAAPSERCGLPDRAVDLAVAAQAVHWFDLDAYYGEARRVLRPGGVIAVWSYHLSRIDPAIDPLLARFEGETLAAWWPARRRLVQEHLRTIPWPFEEIAPLREFRMRAEWTLPDLVEYLASGSAVQRCRAQTGRDPLDEIQAPLAAAWGAAASRRRVEWPLYLRAGRV